MSSLVLFAPNARCLKTILFDSCCHVATDRLDLFVTETRTAIAQHALFLLWALLLGMAFPSCAGKASVRGLLLLSISALVAFLWSYCTKSE